MYEKIEVEQTAVDCEITQKYELDIVRIDKSTNGWLDVTLIGRRVNLEKYLAAVGFEDTEIYFQ
jgi:hypothetical protein